MEVKKMKTKQKEEEKSIFPTNKALGLRNGYDKYGDRWELALIKQTGTAKWYPKLIKQRDKE